MPDRQRVLVVDDDADIRSLALELLDLNGFSAEGAADGKEALALLRRGTYDAVVLDVVMPEKDGIEILMDIKSRQPETFVVAISGGGRIDAHDYLDMATMCGADATLRKPFSFDAMAEMIVEATASRRTLKTAPRGADGAA
jgi:two-component system, chemotaxis family, chemotaxis protein CheY